MDIARGTPTTCDRYESATSVSWNHSLSASETIVFVTVYTGSFNTSNMSVTYGGQSMTLIGSAQYKSYNIWARTFVLKNPPSGVQQVSASWSGASYGRAIAWGYSGVDLDISPAEVTTSNTGTAATSRTVTLNSANEGAWMCAVGIMANVAEATKGLTGVIDSWVSFSEDLVAAADSGGTVPTGSNTGGFTCTTAQLTGLTGWLLYAVTTPPVVYEISGKVWRRGQPQAGVKVRLLAQSGDAVVATDTTDADGAYTFSDLDAEEQYLIFCEYTEDGQSWTARTRANITPWEAQS